jgi:hypothetical protein
VERVRVPKQASVLTYHVFTFNTSLIIFVYYVYALVLFVQYCISVLANLYTYIHIQIYNLEVPDNLRYQTTHSVP